MANEIAEFKITNLTKLNGIANYEKWEPNKVQRVRFEFGTQVLESLDDSELENECNRCDYPMSADNIDIINKRPCHVQCPSDSKNVVYMPGFKAVGKFRILK